MDLLYVSALWRDELTGEGLYAFIYTDERHRDAEGKFYSRLPELERYTQVKGRIEGDRVYVDCLGDMKKITKTKKEKERQERYDEYINKLLKAISLFPSVSVSVLEQAYKKGDLADFGIKCYDYLPFYQADKIAKSSLWIADEIRINAAFNAALEMMENTGHTWYDLEATLKVVQALLGEPYISLSYLYMKTPSWIKKDFETRSIYRASTRSNEWKIVENIRRLIFAEIAKPEISEEILKQAEERCNITLGEEQKEAVLGLLDGKVSILTGDPGTGKTTTIKVLLEVYKIINPDGTVKLAAPTGRAAQRMAEITGLEAETIHRMLGYFSCGDREMIKDLNNPIDADLIICDEFSMVDTELMAWLVGAIKPTTQLIIIGDNYQLESVGPGAVLSDLIDSGKIPHYHLTKIYRQGEKSTILTNSKLIKNGITTLKNEEDCRLLLAKSEEQMAAAAISMIRKNHDLQILIPTKKGTAGTFKLNTEIQHYLNPQTQEKAEIRYAGKTFREGDKVIFTHNLPEHNYLNGDMGKIEKIDGSVLTITTVAGTITATREDLRNLDLAYAITIHKSQGSEFDEGLILLPYSKNSKLLLKRNLIYTALTRCKKKATVIVMNMEENGNKNTLAYSIENVGERRKTKLLEILSGKRI